MKPGEGPVNSLNFYIRPEGAKGYAIVDSVGNEIVPAGVLENRHACKAFMKGAEYAVSDLRWFLGIQAEAMHNRLLTTPELSKPGDKS